MTSSILRPLAIVALAAALPLTATAQAYDPADPWATLRAESFVRPPASVERMVTTPRTDISFDALSSTGAWALRLTGPGRGSIAQYGRPHLYLGGLQVDPNANRARSLTNARFTGIELADPRTGQTRRIETPSGMRVSDATWSPDGNRIAYLAHTNDATHLYIADVASGRSTRLTRTAMLATLVTEPRFTPDGRSLIVVLVPAGRGAAPSHGPNGIEDGPQVRLTEGVAKPQRVHASLLEDLHDKALYKYHTTGQLALVDARSGATRNIGSPAMIRSADASPDGRYLRVTTVVEPFSYIVPHTQFGTVTQLWDTNGRVVATLDERALREGEVEDGPRNPAPDISRRSFAWHPDGGLTYLQTVVGDNNRASAVRWMHWRAPFAAGDTTLLFSGSARFSSVAWGTDKGTFFVNDSGQVSAVRVADVSKKYPLGRGVTLPGGGFGGFGGGGFGGNAQADTVGTGGALQIARGVDGSVMVRMSRDAAAVFVTGTRRYGDEWHRRAPRPFLDRVEIADAKRSRLLDSPASTYEDLVTALDADYQQLVVTRQSATTIEDAWYRDLAAGTERKLTNAVDVGPEVTGAIRKRFQVTRPRDGIKVWVDVVLPRSWRPGAPVPGIIWFYPREYATEQAYARSKWSVNINEFPAVPQLRPASSTELWVAHGYALITPDVPIFGDSGRMNDNFTRDLPENLDAVLDAVVDSGFVTRDQMGIGGHSYGAFGTANAMTLVPYFKAGIAGDGMYNRSLTPFGFQSERRSFYEAQDVYFDMSPFLRAERLAGALLLYHATEDQNVGTAPLASVRMMQALQGLGKTAALYMYHYEDHSVATFESDLDMWARWYAWFDVYVRGMGPKRDVMSR
ncbi:MAG: prolyl oligopeptidase family serine peptidase [Gemmatimonadaceae bacterium]|nr:prolyl oligopeptidase family serine peptidase [Gemmatimonadaceae bacterium]